jgi:hypothetical protein
MDFVAFKEPILGFKYALTYICDSSRYLITIPCLFLKIPRTAIAKAHIFRMVGPYKVIGTNGFLIKITDNFGHEDYVNRAHVCPTVERPETFDKIDNVALPITTIKTAEKPSLNPVIDSSVANCVFHLKVFLHQV